MAQGQKISAMMMKNVIISARSLPTVIKFVPVGVLGAVTNLLMLSLALWMGASVATASTLGFILSVSQNYLLHGYFTWVRSWLDMLSWVRYFSFVSGYLVGGAVMVVTASFLSGSLGFSPVWAQTVGISLAATCNFVVGLVVLKR